MERKSGFYWVKLDGEWIVSEWDDKLLWWGITGWDDSLHDSDFDKINENRIMSPDEWE